MNIDPRLSQIKDCLYRISTKAFIRKNGKFLLAWESGDTGWTFPGGGVDYGESPRDALLRELSEELGQNKEDIKTDFVIKAMNLGQIVHDVPRCNVFFDVSITNDSKIKSSEIDKWQWFDVLDIDSLELDPSTGDLTGVISHLQSSQ
jgi:8-oxo-dGTP pyrophosphatase MutT (NUDIX family)